MFGISKRIWIYVLFFLSLFVVFYIYITRNSNFAQSRLFVINNDIKDFSFTDQNGKTVDYRTVDDKVYVVNYFFTTCRGICPKMNANMRLVYDAYKNEPDFLILSHTCMPEVDSLNRLKKYEKLMINGKLEAGKDGAYFIEPPVDSNAAVTGNKNWYFLTGDKEELYKMARVGYLIDDNRRGQVSNAGKDEFLHTQFFALIDRKRRLRKIYDGLKLDEVKELINDVEELLKEQTVSRSL